MADRPALRATYRLQLTPEYGFDFVRELVPYLSSLGVSHLYLSPTLQAKAGSTHGYDVCDPSRLSAELGGEEAFQALAAAASEAGMGIILDVVPNHMASSEENRYWADPELRKRFFDIDPVSGRWRRFFDVDDLAGIRIERDEVFEATHSKLLELVSSGVVDGLRVDHPDGLADPLGYLRRLSDAGVSRVWVEKILGSEERLPAEWPVSGTVGYEFLNDLIGLCVNPAAEPAFTALWESVSGDSRPFGAWALEAKLEQATGTFSAEVARLGREAGAPDAFAASGEAREQALALALASQPVYRGYLPTSAGPFLTRFQQTSPAVMAKGVEDTTFYRYGRLLALNEVGGDPGRWSLDVEAFHARNAERAARYPEALLTTMTHDAKRSADVRARLVALTWFPDEWTGLVERWLDFASSGGSGGSAGRPDPIDRYFILQTLLGFPMAPEKWERMDGYLEKALRESKRNTSWIDPDTGYEDAAKAWARGLVGSEEFMRDLGSFVGGGSVDDPESVFGLGERISQVWAALKILSPGVPDIYQGDEMPFSALVDPDNRRPVNWDVRRKAAQGDTDGVPQKFRLIQELLSLRARVPEAFGPGSTYTPLPTDPGTVSFLRGTAARPDRVRVTVGIAPSTAGGFQVAVRDMDDRA